MICEKSEGQMWQNLLATIQRVSIANWKSAAEVHRLMLIEKRNSLRLRKHSREALSAKSSAEADVCLNYRHRSGCAFAPGTP